MIVDDNFAREGLLQSGNTAKRRRLAAAARAEQGKQLAFAHFKGDAAKRADFASGAGERFFQIFNCDHFEADLFRSFAPLGGLARVKFRILPQCRQARQESRLA